MGVKVRLPEICEKVFCKVYTDGVVTSDLGRDSLGVGQGSN